MDQVVNGKPKIVAVIPVRYASKRLPGKSLADICGKPLLWWLYQNAKKVKEIEEVYVVTPDKIVMDKCKELGMKYVQTGEHPTGSDRVAAAAKGMDAQVIIDVQDHPTISPENIKKLIGPFLRGEKVSVCSLITKITSPEELAKNNIFKVIFNKDHELIYVSRAKIPEVKQQGTYIPVYYKLISIWAHSAPALQDFSSMAPGELEMAESNEFIRYLENKIPVKLIEIDEDPPSVDVPEDLDKVRSVMTEKLKKAL